MRISPAWLKEFVNFDLGPAELADRLTMVGLAVDSVEGSGEQTVLELDVTSNRPDCLGHYGVAREVAALTAAELKPLAASAVPIDEAQASTAPLRVTVEAPEACARYCARVLENLRIGPSPAPAAHRLELMDSRPINNLADLTNYILFETGHPTHAFDADTLEGGEIRVRYAREGETLVTLDGVERTLDPADLVIADAVRPVALAGVMGGEATAITEKTRRVVIESAWFEPLGIRRTAKRHGMHTDASHRFERGADLAMAPAAADRIAGLAQSWAGAHAVGGLIDVYPVAIEPQTVSLRAGRLRRVLGAAVPTGQVSGILNRLGFAVLESAGEGDDAVWTVQLPTWRPDVQREVDLVEEVARVFGFDHFPAQLPEFRGAAQPLPNAVLRDRLRSQLRVRGYAEVIALSFASREECGRFAPVAEPVEILNPLSEEASILRTSTLPSMLHLLRNNLNRGLEDIRLYEIGKVYELNPFHSQRGTLRTPEGAVREVAVLTLGACGAGVPASWAERVRPFDFFDLKGEVEAILGSFDVKQMYFDTLTPAYYHPGRAARVVVNGWTVGSFGQLHPEIAAEWKLKPEIWLAAILLDRLERTGARPVQYRPPSRFPSSERDFSFQFADRVTWEEIRTALTGLRLEALTELAPLEVFRGGPIPAGQYNLLLRARFQRGDRTLREEEVQAGATAIMAALQSLGGQQR